MTIEFENPVNGRKEPISLSELLVLIAERGQDYWNSPTNNSTAMLRRVVAHSDTPMIERLVFTKSDRAGFHFEFQRFWPATGLQEYWFCVGSADLETMITLGVAGEGTQLPAALFVDDACAARVVTHFFVHGGMAPTEKWIDTKDVKLDEPDW